MLQDLHTHTTYCDGTSSPEEMVLSAIEKGLDRIGICTHGYTAFDESYCIPHEEYGKFQAEVAALKEKYKDEIEVLCGVEQDVFSETETDGFDYVIGSVHYLKAEDEFAPIDEMVEILEYVCEEYYGGDYLAATESYYASVAQLAEKTDCDIIGHFDLITKFNEGGALFDEKAPRYVAAWKAAADELLKSGKVFEINTGAISRGYRTTPYPSDEITEYIRANGGKFILSSDAHSKDTIAYDFEKYGGRL